jgi:NADH-quinone oxidoreductase subunit J
MIPLAAQATTSGGEAWLFWIAGPLAVVAALFMVFARKAVHSALALALVMILLAVFYITQHAPFLGVVQVVVYTGAVMMLFLFVLMLVGVGAQDSLVETLRGQRPAAALATLALVVLLAAGVGQATFAPTRPLTQASASGNVPAIAQLLFTRYVWAFEVTSALLITAALGTMVFAHRERTAPRASQREMSVARFKAAATGGQVTMLPPPGVYARHNAVDVPGLLPDGSPSPLTINKILAARGDVRDVESFERPEIGEGRADPEAEARR